MANPDDGVILKKLRKEQMKVCVKTVTYHENGMQLHEWNWKGILYLKLCASHQDFGYFWFEH